MANYDAVFFIGFGGPEKKEDIRPFLEIVTKGRPIPPARIEEVVHHYEVIGGKSPINEITNAQADGLRRELKAAGQAWPVYVGNRNWHPFIEESLRKMKADGVKRAIGFYTAAHRSEASLERYLNAVETAREKIGEGAPVIDLVGPWFDHPLFIEAICERIKELNVVTPAARKPGSIVMDPPLTTAGDDIGWVFTAHSIPCCMAKDSTYVMELQKTAALVAERFGNPPWTLAYSSRSGRPTDPWLEPDICDLIRARAEQGQKHLLIIPIGFIADHVEILFDLDVEAKEAAQEVGVSIYRAKSVGDHPVFCRMIADVVQKRAAASVIPEMTSSKSTRDQSGTVNTAPGAMAKMCYCQPDAANPPCQQPPARPAGAHPGHARQH